MKNQGALAIADAEAPELLAEAEVPPAKDRLRIVANLTR